MDEITRVKTKFRQEQWKKIIADCQSSDLKVDDWCTENNIKRSAYYYWLRKIRTITCEAILPAIQKQDQPVTFAKIEIPSHQSSPSAAIVVHLSNASLEVREGSSQKTIEAVLLALKNIC